MRYRHTQRGLSLIELMIAMVVSLVLIAGVGTVYLSSKRNYQARDQLSLMDESARIALTALSKHLEHAGYASSNKLPIGAYLYVKGENNPPVAKCSNGSDTGVHSSLNLSTFAARASQDDYKPTSTTVSGDTISVRFLGDDNLFSDCANGELPSPCRVGNAPSIEASLIYNTFFINHSSGQPTLMCAGTRTPATAPIAPGIENMQILYGVDRNADGTVDKYVNATNLASGERQQVVSIKVGLLVRSLEPVLPAAESRTYQVLDKTINTNDRFQRAVYSTVIHLRNVIDG